MTDGARLLVVDDEWVVGRAVQQVLEARGYQVTAVVSTAQDAVQSLSSTSPTLLLLDIQLDGDEGGLAVAHAASARGIPFIYVMGECDSPTLQRAVELGPLSLLRKPFEETHLLATVERALTKLSGNGVQLDTSNRSGPSKRGESSGYRQIMLRRLAETARDPQAVYRRQPQLSPREFEVLRCLMAGASTKTIAERLGLSPVTVSKYLGSIYRKLGVNSRRQLVRELHAAAEPVLLTASHG